MITVADSLWFDLFESVGPIMRWPLTVLYIGVLLLICVYGLHRYWLVWLFRRTSATPRPSPRPFAELPVVTVQLPMYNEASVAERIIDAACKLDYPADKLQIQVIDDSTDGSAVIARRRAAYWADRKVDIQYLHRCHRDGYKAGALAAALPRAKGRIIAIFDADFVPPPRFLKDTVHHFTDPGVGMVQARWGHLNRGDSALTRSQAIFLDGHFLIEHAARHQSGRWINFNGTAGLWRQDAIESAGGWQSDTLTEDMDLSYRAQLAGWRFVFLPQVVCPAELPPEINAFKAQQHRWTKGSIQTARKILPRLLRADVPMRIKVEALFHLTSPMVYIYVTLMVLLFFPAFFVNLEPFEEGTAAGVLWGMTLFALGTASAGTFYVVSQAVQRRSAWATIAQLPMLMSIGIGIALNNTRGVIEALIGHQSAFVRTPKYNTTAAAPEGAPSAPRRRRVGRRVLPTPSIKVWMSLIELGMGLYCLVCARLALGDERTLVSLPFLLLFAGGYFYVGLTSFWGCRRSARSGGDALPQPV